MAERNFRRVQRRHKRKHDGKVILKLELTHGSASSTSIPHELWKPWDDKSLRITRNDAPVDWNRIEMNVSDLKTFASWKRESKTYASTNRKTYTIDSDGSTEGYEERYNSSGNDRFNEKAKTLARNKNFQYVVNLINWHLKNRPELAMYFVRMDILKTVTHASTSKISSIVQERILVTGAQTTFKFDIES